LWLSRLFLSAFRHRTTTPHTSEFP